jgi:hypothetical protein
LKEENEVSYFYLIRTHMVQENAKII